MRGCLPQLSVTCIMLHDVLYWLWNNQCKTLNNLSSTDPTCFLCCLHAGSDLRIYILCSILLHLIEESAFSFFSHECVQMKQMDIGRFLNSFAILSWKQFTDHMLQIYRLISPIVCAIYTDVQTLNNQISVYTNLSFDMSLLNGKLGRYQASGQIFSALSSFFVNQLKFENYIILC